MCGWCVCRSKPLACYVTSDTRPRPKRAVLVPTHRQGRFTPFIIINDCLFQGCRYCLEENCPFLLLLHYYYRWAGRIRSASY
jgi:hypothetical protein